MLFLSIHTPSILHFSYILGANFASLSHGDVSVMLTQIPSDTWNVFLSFFLLLRLILLVPVKDIFFFPWEMNISTNDFDYSLLALRQCTGDQLNLPVHRYSIFIFTFSGLLGLQYSTLLFESRVALNPELGDVRDVASAITSHEQTQ